MKMEFSSNVDSVSLTKSGFLEAKLIFGRRKKVSLDLNKCLGNNDGNFDINGVNFMDSGKWFSIQKKYNGSYILRGHLKRSDGFFTNISEIDLDTVVAIRKEDRELVCRKRVSSRRRETSPRKKSSRRKPSSRKKGKIYIKPPDVEATCIIS